MLKTQPSSGTFVPQPPRSASSDPSGAAENRATVWKLQPRKSLHIWWRRSSGISHLSFKKKTTVTRIQNILRFTENSIPRLLRLGVLGEGPISDSNATVDANGAGNGRYAALARWNWTRRRHGSAQPAQRRADECWLSDFETHLTAALPRRQKGVR